ncbi:MAG: hypothetical protein ACRD8W_22925, partial [Nitrososphaeraceae archaeon]
MKPWINKVTQEDKSQRFEGQPNFQERGSKKNEIGSDQLDSHVQQNGSCLRHRRPPTSPNRPRRLTPSLIGHAAIEEPN